MAGAGSLEGGWGMKGIPEKKKPAWDDGEGAEQPAHGGPAERLPGLASLWEW